MPTTTLVETWTYQRMVDELPPETPYELFDGELIDNTMSPAPNFQHQHISRELEYLMITFCRNHKLGQVYDAPFDVIFDKNNVTQPDILYISNENMKNMGKQGFFGTPELIVEIISPRSFYDDQVRKKDLYERFGVQEYWIIEPANQVIEVFELLDKKYELFSYVAEEGIAKSKLLDGFEVDSKEIFIQK